MLDYATRSKFTMKPPVQEFFNSLALSYCFQDGNSFHLCSLVNLSTTKFAICSYKARLDGEHCLTDVIMHKGYILH